MKAILLLALITLAACSRAQWQEDRGDGALAQEQTPPAENPQPLNPGAPPSLPSHRPPQTFDSCKSQTLSVVIDTSKTQDNLKDFWTTSARYPLIRVTEAAKTRKKSTFFLTATDKNSHACADQACADEAGWSLIQNDILDLNGMTLMCEGQPAPPDATPTPAPQPGPADSGDGRG